MSAILYLSIGLLCWPIQENSRNKKGGIRAAPLEIVNSSQLLRLLTALGRLRWLRLLLFRCWRRWLRSAAGALLGARLRLAHAVRIRSGRRAAAGRRGV